MAFVTVEELSVSPQTDIQKHLYARYKHTMLKTLFLKKWLRVEKEKESQPTLNRQSWELDSESLINWLDEEQREIKTLAKRRQFLAVDFDSIPHSYQTSLIEFHPQRNQLVIDSVVPALPASLHDLQLYGWIELPLPDGYIKLRISLEHSKMLNGYPSFTCQIHQKQVMKDRRSDTRVQFQSGKAPNIKLTLPLSSEISAEIDNLSSGGVAARCYQREFPRLLSKEGDCKITFGEHFQVKTRCVVKSVRLVRQPSFHYYVRVTFHEIGAQKSDQINAFIAELCH